MKKSLALLLCCIVGTSFILPFAAAAENTAIIQAAEQNEYGISVSPQEITVAEGESFQINVSYDSESVSMESVQFCSYGNCTAVNSLGKATAYNAGEDEIEVTAIVRTADNSYKDISFSVQVHITAEEILSDENRSEFDRLEGYKCDNYQRRKVELAGGLNGNSSRICMEQIMEFIGSSDSPAELFQQIDSVHSYPDLISGSGVIFSEYWFDEKGNEKIVCRTDFGQEELCYYKISDNGTILEKRLIYPETVDYSCEVLCTDYHYRQYNQSEADGDINADGRFNAADLVTARKLISGTNESIYKNWEVVNFCNDSSLNIFDFCIMKHRLISSTVNLSYGHTNQSSLNSIKCWHMTSLKMLICSGFGL